MTDWHRIDDPEYPPPKDGTRILLAKFDWAHGLGAFFPRLDDNLTYGLWWVSAGYWSDKWENWNDGIEPSGLAGPTHWAEITLPEPPGDEKSPCHHVWQERYVPICREKCAKCGRYRFTWEDTSVMEKGGDALCIPGHRTTTR